MRHLTTFDGRSFEISIDLKWGKWHALPHARNMVTPLADLLLPRWPLTRLLWCVSAPRALHNGDLPTRWADYLYTVSPHRSVMARGRRFPLAQTEGRWIMPARASDCTNAPQYHTSLLLSQEYHANTHSNNTFVSKLLLFDVNVSSEHDVPELPELEPSGRILYSKQLNKNKVTIILALSRARVMVTLYEL